MNIHIPLRKFARPSKRPRDSSKSSSSSVLLKLVLLFGALAFAPIIASAQTQVFTRWDVTLNNFSPAAIAADAQGNVYLVGNAFGEMLTMKYNSDGRVLWESWLGDANQFPAGVDIGVDGDGNVYSLGVLNSEFATAKYNSSGVRQWVDYFSFPGGQITPTNIAVKPDGHVFVSGTGVQNGTGGNEALLIAYSPTGAQLWERSSSFTGFDGTPRGVAIGVAADPQGNAVLGVYYDADNQEYYSGVTKYDANGNGIASNAGTALAELRNLKLDSQGNWYVTGTGDFTDLTGNAHYIAAKYNPSGQVIWFDDLAPSGIGCNCPALHIAPNADGSVFLSPIPGDSSNNTLAKFSSTGARLWTVQVSGLIASNSIGYVYVAAANLSKYDPNGVLIWQRPFVGPSNQAGSPSAMTMEGGDLLLTGTTTVNNTGASLTADYVQDAAKLTPLSLTFPAQAVGTQSPAQTITLKNTAEQSLAILSITSQSLDFPQTNNCPASLAPGASCTISVTFAPASTGTVTSQLEVKDPWAGSPQFVKLSGTTAP
jgi:Cep192 domain 4